MWLSKCYRDESSLRLQNLVNTFKHFHHLAYSCRVGIPWITTVHEQDIHGSFLNDKIKALAAERQFQHVSLENLDAMESRNQQAVAHPVHSSIGKINAGDVGDAVLEQLFTEARVPTTKLKHGIGGMDVAADEMLEVRVVLEPLVVLLRFEAFVPSKIAGRTD